MKWEVCILSSVTAWPKDRYSQDLDCKVVRLCDNSPQSVHAQVILVSQESEHRLQCIVTGLVKRKPLVASARAPQKRHRMVRAGMGGSAR